MMNSEAGGWMMGGMWLFPILFWILIITGVMLINRWLAAREGSGRTVPAESPLNIVKMRYAKGEIDKETFEKIKQDIEDSDHEKLS